MDDLVKSSSFRKWVNGEASHEQKEYWDQWVKNNPENRRLAKKAQQKIAGFSIEEYTDASVQQSWDLLNKKLRQRSKLNKGKRVSNIGNTGVAWVLRIAAALLLAAVTGFAVYFYHTPDDHVESKKYGQNEVKTDYGEQKEISLSDGSIITLNAHSSLIYKVNNKNPQNVQVFLQGEAYFSVAKRNGPNASPFKVRTQGGVIQVLGTEFVVSTRNNKTRVVLEEGSVAVEPLAKNKERIFLKPGEMAELDSSWDIVYTKEVNTKVYTSWKSHELVFDETPLAEVIDRIENTYGIHVIVRNPDLFTQRITGSIKNTDLDVITSVLSMTLDTSVHIDENTVYLGI
ncbi:MAG: FecR domain-containing protein [Balneolaceae bacterium]|nr:FecR domain-containing protein [Balneolaceae bacterium]